MSDGFAKAPVIVERLTDDGNQASLNDGDYDLKGGAARHRFREFIRNFKLQNIFEYRDSLLRHWERHEYYVDIDLAHVNEYDELLFNNLQTRPSEIIPYCESGVKDALKLFLTGQGTIEVANASVPEFQIVWRSAEEPQLLRNLTAEHVNRLTKVPGIVIKCSEIRAKATSIVVRCSKCHCTERLSCLNAIGVVSIPPKCASARAPQQPGAVDCGPGSYVVMADYCEFIDQQKVKLQECPEAVPTGEMPRNILLTLDRYLVDRISPGTRVSVMGILSVFNAGAKQRLQANTSIKTPYLKVVGIQIESEGGGRVSCNFTQQEEDMFQRFAREPEIYEKISRSIAPQISGDYTVDIKKALACLLMGGSRKVLPDGVRLRGDINILLMGDPSTAKSQFLKFIERVSPIGVYTSGKGSSAAGLTASVTKDAKGEFYLEGGAMVLADGGVICIDEFDKMRDTDRVAIHEAMEQQTISIAKAGITTMLNSRTSVLAAANPIFGRYDDLKGVGENIDLMSTILSRFDCIFIVRDVRDEERDRSMARFVMGVHRHAALQDAASTVDANVIEVSVLKKYVAYCRERCAPRLNDEAASQLSSHYVTIRNQVRESLKDAPGEAQVVPITIRQLEALVRLSESLAKMRLSAEATVADVDEAMRLFKKSTLAASEANPALMGALGNSSDDVKRAEDFLKRRMGLRMTLNTKKVVEEALVLGYADDAIRRAIAAMVMRSELQEINQCKLIRRIR